MNKTAIVTGGARRIGAAICRHIHACGLDLVIHYHTSDKAAEDLMLELNELRPNSACLIKADLGNADYADFIAEAAAFKGHIDTLVNNASLYYPTPLESLTKNQWRELMDTNLLAPLNLSRAATRSLSARNGCIINITDIYAEIPLPDHVIYAMSQAGLTQMTRVLARELAPRIRVNAIAPGAILWPENIPAMQKPAVLAGIPLQRTGEVIDIARAVEFLIEDADYLTGQVLTIDGGRRLTLQKMLITGA